MDRATPARKLRRQSLPSRVRSSAAVKTVFLVVPALVVQGPAARIESTLVGIEPMLLMPMRPPPFVLAPVIITMNRLTVHLPADVPQHITRRLSVHWQGTQRQYGRNGQHG